MNKLDAAKIISGLTDFETEQSPAPTNVHIITGEVGSTSEDGKVMVSLDGLVFSDDNEQFVEFDTLGGLEEGDTATILLTGENGKAMVPLAIGGVGTVDRIVERVGELYADYAEIGELVAEKASITDLEAATARIGDLEADHVSVDDLDAATARIGSLEADHVSVSDFQAEQANIDTLQANTADIATIRANSAKVQNLTAAQLEADHATIGTLDTTYMHANMSNSDVAWIENGTIKNGAIVSAMINDVSANKLTAGTINGSVINVTNLNADNITTGTINGQRIGEGSLSLSKLEDDVYTESEIDSKLATMQAEIDGAIETWTGTAVPTLNNSPASGWTTNAIRDTHVGDVYFVVNSQSQQNGYNYRFTKSGSTYSWQLIKDSDVTNALQRLETAEGKITTFDSDISTLKTDTGSLTTRTTNLETRMSDAEDDILDKVDTTTFNEVSDTVDAHTQTISQHTTALSNKADNSTVTAVTNRVSKNEQDISGINTTIGQLQTTVASKADGSTVTTISNKLNTVSDTVDGHTQTITSVQNTLSTKADTSDVTALEGRVSTAESNITQNANNIALKVSESDVTGNYVVGKINLNSTTATIAANRVNIEGAAIFTGNGRLSQTSLNNAYDANGAAATAKNEAIAAIPTDISSFNNDSGYQTASQVSSAVSNGVSGKADSSSANSREQLIYRSAVANTSSMSATTTWVTDVTGGQNKWTAKRPEYSSSYPVLFVATQRQTVAQSSGTTCSCTTPVKDDTTTVIDGAHITTGTIDTNRLNADTIKSNIVQTTNLSASQITSGDISADRIKANVIGAINSLTAGQIDAARINASQLTIGQSQVTNLTSDLYQSAQPNLTPFFEIAPTDTTYWFATGNLSSYTTRLGNGWSHVEYSNLNLNVSPRVGVLDLSESTTYTVMLEVRNAVTLTNCRLSIYTATNSTWSASKNIVISENGTYYITGVTKDDLSSTDITHLRVFFGSDTSTVNADIRLSLYEGEYSGPYKPYNGGQLYAQKSDVTWTGTCDTAAGTAAKEVACDGFTASELTMGATICVRLNAANTSTGALTLNVNGTGAKPISVATGTASATNQLLWASGATIRFMYNASIGQWRVADTTPTYYSTCSIAEGVAAKTAGCAGCVIFKGVAIHIVMTAANTNTSATLNVNSTGAKAIYYGNTSTRPTTANEYGWKAGATASFVFDGAYWRYADASAMYQSADAAKTATNYIVADSSGIKIADANPSSSTTYQHQTSSGTDFVVNGGVRNRVDSTGMTLYNGSGTADANIVAKFTESLIEIGKNSTSAVIKFCGGVASLTYTTANKFFNITALRSALRGVSEYENTETANAQVAAQFDVSSDAGTTNTAILLQTATSSTASSNMQATASGSPSASVELGSGNGTSTITMLANYGLKLNNGPNYIKGFNFGFSTGTTNSNGITTFNPGMGVAPTAVFVAAGKASNETEAVAKIAVPMVWSIDGATQVQVRWQRSDTNAWLASNAVGWYWLAIY